MTRTRRLHCVVMFCLCLFAVPGQAQQSIHDTSNVPPSLEIEVLDPGVDPLGHPAVLMKASRLEDTQEIDIPPAVLVHRYYYTGDRSFQAQLLPGGPCIVVAHHPKSAEKLYIPVQMLPGAPRVTYKRTAIKYDFGKTQVIICFHRKGHASVKYRTGPTVWERVEKTLHTGELRDIAGSMSQKVGRQTSKSATFAKGAVLFTGDAVGVIATPVKQLFSIGPLADLDQRMEARVAQHHAGSSETQIRDADREFEPRFR